jgi:hypothetical protein
LPVPSSSPTLNRPHCVPPWHSPGRSMLHRNTRDEQISQFSPPQPSAQSQRSVAVDPVLADPTVQARRRHALVDIASAGGALPTGLALAVEPARPARLRLRDRLVPGDDLLRTWPSPTLRLAWHWSPCSGVTPGKGASNFTNFLRKLR